jgi:NitT/TauT family transport system permease protein
VVVVLVFFPVFINTARGLIEADPSHLELMNSYAAGRWRVMRDVRIPNALPYLFSAMKLSSSLAVIGAIVAEYFGGRQDVLGQVITQQAGLTRYAEAWAAVVAGAVIGAALYTIVVVAERLGISWDATGQQGH